LEELGLDEEEIEKL